MKTRQIKNLYFQFKDILNGMTVYEFAEFLQSEGLIQAVERDEYSGSITRYAETEILYRCDDKTALVSQAVKARGGQRG